MNTHHLNTGLSLPRVHKVPLDRPIAWLWQGWLDLRANPLPSLAYGLLFGLGGDMILLAALDQPYLFTVALSGFFLVAPLLAVGLYELSRAHAVGIRYGFIDSLHGPRRNLPSFCLFGLMLALIAVFWERISALVFALFGDTTSITTLGFMEGLLGSLDNWPLLLAWGTVGGLLAALVFACSVVAVPMLLDQEEMDPVTACISSLNCVLKNPGPMAIWAALIVALVFLGFATLLFGLIVLMPLLGHASWHAYRDLVE